MQRGLAYRWFSILMARCLLRPHRVVIRHLSLVLRLLHLIARLGVVASISMVLLDLDGVHVFLLWRWHRCCLDRALVGSLDSDVDGLA